MNSWPSVWLSFPSAGITGCEPPGPATLALGSALFSYFCRMSPEALSNVSQNQTAVIGLEEEGHRNDVLLSSSHAVDT